MPAECHPATAGPIAEHPDSRRPVRILADLPEEERPFSIPLHRPAA
jgi:hypothetical protein